MNSSYVAGSLSPYHPRPTVPMMPMVIGEKWRTKVRKNKIGRPQAGRPASSSKQRQAASRGKLSASQRKQQQQRYGALVNCT